MVLVRAVPNPLALFTWSRAGRGAGLGNQTEVCALTMCVLDWAPPEELIDTLNYWVYTA